VAAGVAKVAAETAETNAETAQAASETAKTASEAAKVAAETAETNASTSASTATTQAGIATTKAGEAAASATASANSATASEAAKDAALAALDNFDDRYLGAKASDPTVDNDGNPLISGSLYFNTTDDVMKVYEGSQWVAAYASLSGALLVANNLSDLASASAGRTNLGLGTAATTASTDYATAAQGALAASATQPGDLATVATSGAYSDLSGTPSPFDPSTLATVATSGAYSDLSGKPTLGTAASTASTDYATAAQGALAASATQPGDLGTAATAAATDFVAVTGDSMTGNLSFGDNDKAIFGAGSDLAIFSNGTDSFIQEYTTGGHLYIDGTNVRIRNRNDNTLRLQTSDSGAVDLYYAGSAKLATSSSGCDINGTLTSDGLTVDGAVAINGTSAGQLTIDATGQYGQILFEQNSGNNSGGDIVYDHTSDQLWFRSLAVGGINLKTSSTAGSAIDRLTVSYNGDISFFEDTGTTPKFFWDSSAEALGIGTTSTGGETFVVEKSSGTPTIRINAPSGSQAQLKLQADGTVTDTQMIHANTDASLGFSRWNGAAYQEHMRISPSGFVGIGTSSPSEKLVLANGSNEIKIGQDGSSHDIFSNGKTFNIGTIDDTVVRMFQNNSEIMRLSGGNLLVGKTSTSSTTAGGNIFGGLGSFVRDGNTPLSLNRRTNDGEIISFAGQDNVVGNIGVANGDNLYISSDDTNDVGVKFNGDGNRITPCDASGADRNGAIDLGEGSARFKDAYFSGTVNAANFNTTSDQTLKTNVETLSGSLDAVTSLRGVSFDWLENGGSEIGVIAQEVEAVLPDVVSTNDEGIKSVKYGNMVAVLIEAIKEQQLRIEALEAKLGD
jgi:hypothetical protein